MVEKLIDPTICHAITQCNLSEIKQFIKVHPEHINCYTPFAGGTWLHFAAGMELEGENENYLEVVKCLVELGFDPNKGDSMDGSLPIVSAAREANYDVAKYLLKVGSRLDVNGSGSASNPLFAAIQGGSAKIVKLFLEAGIDTSRTYGEKDNIDALAFAVLYGQTEIAQVLALHNANNNSVDAERLILQAKEAVKPIGGLKQIHILPYA